jgi:5-methylcytosine-specific restriction endonuclease McrA
MKQYPWNKGKGIWPDGFRRKEYMKEYLRAYRLKNRKILNQYFKDNKDVLNEKRRAYRHKKGFCKKHISKYGGNRFTSKECVQRRRSLQKGGGALSIKTIQLVYENNIKNYGTLTCYLCLRKIEFGQDSLEHKTPLSRGGTNAQENLEIAHIGCNSRKHNLTEQEYRRKHGH